MESVSLELWSYKCACTNVSFLCVWIWEVSFQRVALWSKSHWSEPKEKEKKKDRIIIEAPHVLCECVVKANYGLVPLELGMGHWCGHRADYDEVGYCCWKHEIDFFLP